MIHLRWFWSVDLGENLNFENLDDSIGSIGGIGKYTSTGWIVYKIGYKGKLQLPW